MNVYTADTFLMARLDKLPGIYKKVRVHKQDGVTIAADYQADKSMLTLRNKKRAPRRMSEKEKAALRERFSKAMA